MADFQTQSELDELLEDMIRADRESQRVLQEDLEVEQLVDQPVAGTVSLEMPGQEAEPTEYNSQRLQYPVPVTQAEHISGEAKLTENPDLPFISWTNFLHMDNEDWMTPANDQEEAEDSPNELHHIIQDNPTVPSHLARETMLQKQEIVDAKQTQAEGMAPQERLPLLEEIGTFLRGLSDETLRDLLGPRFHAASPQSAQPAVEHGIREPLMESWNRGGSGLATADRATKTMVHAEQDKVLEASTRKRQAPDFEDQENQPPQKRRHILPDQVLPSEFRPQLDTSWIPHGTTLGGPMGETRKYLVSPRSARTKKAVKSSFQPNQWSQDPTATPSRFASGDDGPSPSDSWESSRGILRQDEKSEQPPALDPSLIHLDETPVDATSGLLDLAWSSNQQDGGEAPTSGANDPSPIGGPTAPASDPMNDADSPDDKNWMLEWQRCFGGDDGDNIPDILFQWKPSPTWHESGTSLQEDWICPWTEERMEDPTKSRRGRSRYLKRFAELPDELPREVPGWYLEWVLRLNPKITLTDIKVRIRPNRTESVEEAKKSFKKLSNCLTQRSLRYRESRYMISWSPSKESPNWAEIVKEKLKPHMIENNTTRGMEKLNTAQIKAFKNLKPNKRPQRGARPNSNRKRQATSDETKVEQDGHDSTLDEATSAPVPENLGDHSAADAGPCGDLPARAKRARIEEESGVDSLDTPQSEIPRPLLATGASTAVEVAEEANGGSSCPQHTLPWPPPIQLGNSLSAVSPAAITGDPGHGAFLPPLPDIPVLSKEDGRGWENLLRELEGEPEEEPCPFQSQLNTIQVADVPESGLPTPPSDNEGPPLSPTTLGILGLIAEWNANN